MRKKVTFSNKIKIYEFDKNLPVNRISKKKIKKPIKTKFKLSNLLLIGLLITIIIFYILSILI